MKKSEYVPPDVVACACVRAEDHRGELTSMSLTLALSFVRALCLSACAVSVVWCLVSVVHGQWGPTKHGAPWATPVQLHRAAVLGAAQARRAEVELCIL